MRTPDRLPEAGAVRQCLDHHADVTFRRRARPPFWFPWDSTRTIDQERSRSCAAQANVLWPGTFSATLNDPTWNATAVFFALSRLRFVSVRGEASPWTPPKGDISTVPVFASCFEWIAFPSALPQTRDNRRGARTGGIAGKVVECVSVSNAPLYSLLFYQYRRLATECQVAYPQLS